MLETWIVLVAVVVVLELEPQHRGPSEIQQACRSIGRTPLLEVADTAAVDMAVAEEMAVAAQEDAVAEPEEAVAVAGTPRGGTAQLGSLPELLRSSLHPEEEPERPLHK